MTCLMPLLKLTRVHFHALGLRCSNFPPEILFSRFCQATADGLAPKDIPEMTKTRPFASSPDGHSNEPPFLFSSQCLDVERAQIERPFLFRLERKKKKKKKRQKSAKDYDREQDVTSDLIESEDDNVAVRQAIEIFNTIPPGGRKSENDFSSKRKDKFLFSLIDEFRKSKSHILGLPGDELKSRYDFLCSHGVKQIDALEISLGFPSYLTLQDNNIVKLINLYAAYKVDLRRLFCNFPFVFSLQYHDVLRKLDHLGSIGLKKKDVGALLENNPSLICFELNDATKIALKFSTSFSGWKSPAAKSTFIESLFRTVAQEHYHMYEFDDNFTSVASILSELNVPVNDIFLKYPDLFSTCKGKILNIVHYLGDSPFFFDADDTGRFIQKFPDIFLQLDDEKVKQQINYAWKELGRDIDFYELLQTSPKMLMESECLRDRVELFKHWSFKSSHIGYLMKKFPILFIENRVVENLKDRLDFLLGCGDLSVSDVMKFPFCLQLRIVLLRCKIGFIRSKDPEILKRTELQKIFTAKLDTFAINICSSTLSELNDFMKQNFSIADQEWIQRKGKPREIKAISESF